jgi:molybdopterin converting factor small subunit
MLNKREEDFELENNTHLFNLLNKIAEKYGLPFKKEVYEPGIEEIKTGFSVTINGVFIGRLDGLDSKLNNGDTVLLMSLMSGG